MYFSNKHRILDIYTSSFYYISFWTVHTFSFKQAFYKDIEIELF